MLPEADLVAFVGSCDLERSDRFYAETLGLDRTESSAFANVYSAGGVDLRVTLVDEPARAPYTVLGFRVPDISAAVDSLRACGVAFRTYESMAQDDFVWTSPSGARIAWFNDPDENILSIQQPG